MENRIIPDSEFIINPDGSVFHLHLLPEQLTDKIIVVGDPARVNMVASHFDTITFEASNREYHTIGGTYKGKPIMCLSHGVGAMNLDIVMTELDALANIDFKTRQVKPTLRQLSIVRVGTSGATQPEFEVGTPIVSRYAVDMTGVLNFYQGRDEVSNLELEKAFVAGVKWNKLWCRPNVVASDDELVDRIGKGFVKGITLTADGFYGPQGRHVRLPLAEPEFNDSVQTFSYTDTDGSIYHVTNYEMESATLQGLGKLMEHKCMTICTIIANRMNKNALPNYKTAVDELVKVVLDRI